MRRPLVLLAAAGLVSALAAPAIASDEPDFGADSILILAPWFSNGYWWDHTTLTVNIKAAGNVDPSDVLAVHEALDVWNEAIAHRHGPDSVQMVVVSGDPVTAARADIVVNLHAQGGVNLGVANCQSGQHCQVPIWNGERADLSSRPAVPLSYEEMVSLLTHELGHTLGLGHTEPLFGTSDVMGYGVGVGSEERLPAAVISECNMDAFDHVWAWAVNGDDPYPPTSPAIACS